MHQVFISYSTKNKGIADAICLHLESHGIPCWYAPRNILPGKDWVEAIMDAIETAKVFLLIYSSDSNQSRQVQNEVAAAFNAGCAIVPFRIDDTRMVSKMAYFLNSVHWLDAAHSPPANTFDELISYIPALLGTTVNPPAAAAKKEPAQQPRQVIEYNPARFLQSVLHHSSNPDADVWVKLKLSADHSQENQQVRGTVLLPHGTGKNPRVLVLTKIALKARDARVAGADYAGGEELAEKIVSQNWFDFDVLIASPEIMGTVGRMASLLAPRGLMPSPKAGTLTPVVTEAVRKIKAGQIAYRMDISNCVRCPIGKVHFGAEKLAQNLDALIQAVSENKPAAVSGKFILSCAVTVDGGEERFFTTERYI